jgi:CRISPR type III-A-associated protein Csm2
LSYNSKGNKKCAKQEPIKFEFVEKGYTDEKGNLREELITTEAQDIAKKLYNQGLSNSQLRAFFNEVKAIKSRINESEELFEKNYPFILMLKSKAEYKYRNNGLKSKITKGFRDFINESVDYIKENKSLDTFENFVLFFEAIIGYFYGFGGGNNR